MGSGEEDALDRSALVGGMPIRRVAAVMAIAVLAAANAGCVTDGSGGGARSVVKLVGGGYHSCALFSDDSVRCWGRGAEGQLGTGDFDSRSAPGPAVVIPPAADVVAGTNHTCAVLRGDGRVMCWGEGTPGTLGNGQFLDSAVPQLVSGLTDAVGLAAGEAHSCAVLRDATVRCWGNNDLGQLGSGDGISSATPVPVSGVTGVRSIGALVYGTCSVLLTGEMRCWGWNDSGQVGSGGTASKYETPQVVSGITNAVAVAAANAHACALLSDGSVRCWGWNGRGELGLGFTSGARSTPQIVPGLAGVTSISAGSAPAAGHTCAVAAGVLQCWGWNSQGQLGVGDVSDRLAPASVSVGPVRSVFRGAAHTLAILDDGTLRAWGSNDSGQLGTGDVTPRLVPTPISG